MRLLVIILTTFLTFSCYSSMSSGNPLNCHKALEQALAKPTKPHPSTTKRRAIIIVDPFGHKAGDLLHVFALEKNIQPIFVFSSPLKKWPRSYQRFISLQDNHVVIEHSGSISETIMQIQSAAKNNNLEIIAALPGLEGSAIPLFDEISKTLEIPSNGTAQSQARIQKSLTQERLKDAQLGFIEKSVVHLKGSKSWDKIRAASEALLAKGKSVIIKPDMGAGTTYIFRCKSLQDVRNAFDQIRSHPYFLHNKITALNIEEKLEGPEYIYDSVRSTVIRNNKEETLSILTGVWVYHRAPSGDPLQTDIIDTVEWVPAEKLPEGLIEYAEKALDALEIKFGPTHLEIFHTPQGFRVVDFNARLPGSSPMISAAATGYKRNQILMAVESVTEPNAFFERYSQTDSFIYPTSQHAVVLHLNVYQKGKRPNLDELNRLAQEYQGVFFESRIFPSNPEAELPLSVDLFTPLVKIHLLGSQKDVEKAVLKIKRDHLRGRFYK